MNALYSRLQSTVHYCVLQIVRDPHQAEDLAQEAWLKALQHIDSYRPGTNFVAWIKAIAKNTARDHLRKESRRPAEVLHADHLQLDRPRPGLSVDEQVESRQLAAAVATQMNRLKPDQHTCLQLRFLYGHSPADTALIMGRTEGAIRALTVRSLRRLARVLPDGDSAAELVEELLSIAAGRGRVVGVRITTTQERASTHVSTR
nr:MULTISPECIES: sigma-70 family RNA polymerase sigma factor [unclassified Streptomyces]